jgi:hypothetical protein
MTARWPSAALPRNALLACLLVTMADVSGAIHAFAQTSPRARARPAWT